MFYANNLNRLVFFSFRFSDDGQAVFECLEVDCAENLNPDYYENHSNCIGQHSLNGCCIEKDVCGMQLIEDWF